MHAVELHNEFLSARVLPGIGGGLARLDANIGGATVPVLRPFDYAGDVPRPNQLACFALLPWSNRIAGGFTCDGRSYSIAPNRDGDPCPIHGEGWLLAWQVEEQSATHGRCGLIAARVRRFHTRRRWTTRSMAPSWR
jgi:aldose 1-epimerase